MFDTVAGVPGPFSVALGEVDVRLSTKSTVATGFDMTFANNVGPDEVLVYKGPWLYKTQFSGPSSGPKEFDIQLKLQKLFLYEAPGGKPAVARGVAQVVNGFVVGVSVG